MWRPWNGPQISVIRILILLYHITICSYPLISAIMTTIPATPPSPGVGVRRKGPKALPRLPLSAFSPPNSGTSERFPLPPSPSAVHPDSVVDSNVNLPIDDVTLSQWKKEAGQVLGGRICGVVLSLPEGADVEKTIAQYVSFLMKRFEHRTLDLTNRPQIEIEQRKYSDSFTHRPIPSGRSRTSSSSSNYFVSTNFTLHSIHRAFSGECRNSEMGSRTRSSRWYRRPGCDVWLSAGRLRGSDLKGHRRSTQSSTHHPLFVYTLTISFRVIPDN